MNKKTTIIVGVSAAVLVIGGIFIARSACHDRRGHGGPHGFGAPCGIERLAGPVADKETPEMKTIRHKQADLRADMIRLAAKDGKMEQAKADFLLKKIASEQVFRDANPEWTKYDRFGMRGGPGGRHDGRRGPDGRGPDGAGPKGDSDCAPRGERGPCR